MASVAYAESFHGGGFGSGFIPNPPLCTPLFLSVSFHFYEKGGHVLQKEDVW